VNQGPAFIVITITITTTTTTIHIPHFTADELVVQKAQVLLTKITKSNF